VKVAVLGWDYGELDPDSPGLAAMGRELGHRTTLCTIEEIEYRPGRGGGLELLLGGEPAASFDAVISRANLYGAWQDRVERLALLSNVPGLTVFDPVDVWVRGYSKFQTVQWLARAGLPVPPTRSATTVEHVEAAYAEWGPTIVKPSFGYRGTDVERVTDPAADKELVAGLLARYDTLVCEPYYPTEYGEYRITVAGEVAPINMLKLPAAGSWRCKTLEGASFERYDAPDDLMELAFRATRVMGLTMAGLDILPTAEGGYVILEVNPVPGFLDIFGERPRREALAAVYDWVAKHTS
jgi:glutathione synthase/RimK-type ligase-like ATP-grasp enzyme